MRPRAALRFLMLGYALIVLVSAGLLLGGCSFKEPGTATSDQVVRFFHDDARHVGCWMIYGQGISCLPDKAYQP